MKRSRTHIISARMKLPTFLAALLMLASSALAARSGFREFVTIRGDQLMEGKKPLRFVSFNIPNLHYVEDNVRFDLQNPWRLPDRFEITDALETIRQMGGGVTRPYALSVVRTNDTPDIPRYVLGPGKFNEEAFRAMDMVLQVANEKHVRLIIPLVDNWIWWGGIAEYAGFRGKPGEAFWTDPQVIADFKETIRFVVDRTNTLTGIPYRDEKAILCWETGNELQSPPEWTAQIAAYIKSLDPNHLVMDGYHTTELRPESVSMPDVDIVTTHHYPGGKKSYAQLARENWAKSQGKKAYVVGEFGFVDTPVVAELLEAVRETGISGALIWSLRPRNRDGGFYWHSEPAGGNKYKAYHWPGFDSGCEYDEKNLMALLKREAFAIRKLPTQRLTAPDAPRLLPIFDAGAISWQGSAGALDYVVERAESVLGPWRVAAQSVNETAFQYRPLFTDSLVTPGQWYYRVTARNGIGASRRSNVVGPVAVHNRTIVDDMQNFSRAFRYSGRFSIETRDSRKAKEDAHRIAGVAGSAIIYQLAGPLQICRVDAFFPREISDFRFSVSDTGSDFKAVPANKRTFFGGVGDYDYWKPVRFEAIAGPGPSTARLLKIEYTGEAQIGRVEITCGF
jgi:hypothetical protein